MRVVKVPFGFFSVSVSEKCRNVPILKQGNLENYAELFWRMSKSRYVSQWEKIRNIRLVEEDIKCELENKF